MAVERTTKEFELNLGEMVRTRLSSFVNVRKGIQAKEEAEFQRSIIDNDLSYDDQLSYRKGQLDKEQGKQYPDNNFITEIKTSITYNKKMVRHRKFRDSYFAFLQDMASGRKSLEDHIEYLNDTIDDATDISIIDELKGELMKATGNKRLQDMKIIDSQIQFNQTDRTIKSINEAISLTKTQLTKPDIIKDESLRNVYEQTLAVLEKDKLEIGVEDKMSDMITSSISQDRQHSSLWKINTFSDFQSKGGMTPINIGGVRYDSEQAYWADTLNNYIKNEFVAEYTKENDNLIKTTWNKIGLLPDSHLKSLITNNNLLKSKPELQEFEQTITYAIQNSISNALSYKVKDINSKYHIDTDVMTRGEIEDAMKELEDLKILFGEDYSLSPEIQSLEIKLVSKKKETSTDILQKATEYAEEYGVSLEEAIDKVGPYADIEVPFKTHLEEEPADIAKTILKTGEKATELQEVKKQKEEMEEKVRLAKEKKEAETTTPKFRDTRVNPQTGQKEIYGQQGTWEVLKSVSKVKEPTTPTITPTTKPTTPTGYIVKSGETLWGIAQKQLGSGSRWKELGYTGDPSKLQVGQKLTIPQK